MNDNLEHFGWPCRLPEAGIAAYSDISGEEIYDYEYDENNICDCGLTVREEEKATCYECGYIGCKGCMIYDVDISEYFCESDCFKKYKNFS